MTIEGESGANGEDRPTLLGTQRSALGVSNPELNYVRTRSLSLVSCLCPKTHTEFYWAYKGELSKEPLPTAHACPFAHRCALYFASCRANSVAYGLV